MRPFCQLTLRAIRVDSPPTDPSRPSIADTLKAYRMKTNLCQLELAKELATCLKTYQNWELGRTTPARKSWVRIRKLIGTSLSNPEATV